jgi:hypothetical protein
MRTSRTLLAASVLAVGAAALVAPAASATPTPATCTGTIDIVHMAFRPNPVSPEQSSTVHLVAKNCTSTRQNTSVMWTGRFVGSSSTPPAGCPIIDPVSMPVSFPPLATRRAEIGYLVPGGCTARGLQVTATFREAGGVVAQRTATLHIV